jgi:hypothetical protein
MATEILNINGWDSGWPTGSVSNVDEATAGADGASVSTTSRNDVVIFDLDNTSLTDADTITNVTIKVRGRVQFTVLGEPRFDVELLIGGVSQGIGLGPGLTSSFVTGSYVHFLWHSDWTQAQLNGAQVKVTAKDDLEATTTWYVDCIDVVVTYTPPAANAEPGAGSLALSGKAPAAVEDHLEFPAAGAASLAGAVPTLKREYTDLPPHAVTTLVGQAITLTQAYSVTTYAGVLTGQSMTLAQLLPLAAYSAALSGKVPTITVTQNHVATPATLSLLLEAEPPLLPTTGKEFAGPPIGLAVLASDEPVVVQGQDITITAPQGLLVLAGQAPTRVMGDVAAPAQYAAGLSLSTPITQRGAVMTPANASLVTVTYAPPLIQGDTALMLAGYAPTLTYTYTVYPTAGSASLLGGFVYSEAASSLVFEATLQLTALWHYERRFT